MKYEELKRELTDLLYSTWVNGVAKSVTTITSFADKNILTAEDTEISKAFGELLRLTTGSLHDKPSNVQIFLKGRVEELIHQIAHLVSDGESVVDTNDEIKEEEPDVAGPPPKFAVKKNPSVRMRVRPKGHKPGCGCCICGREEEPEITREKLKSALDDLGEQFRCSQTRNVSRISRANVMKREAGIVTVNETPQRIDKMHKCSLCGAPPTPVVVKHPKWKQLNDPMWKNAVSCANDDCELSGSAFVVDHWNALGNKLDKVQEALEVFSRKRQSITQGIPALDL